MFVGIGRGGLCIRACVTIVVYSLFQFIIVYLVAVLALGLFAIRFHHLVESQTLRFDSLVRSLDSLEHNRLRHFFHLTLNHHDVVVGGSHHQFEVSLLTLLKGRVDNHLTVYACHAHLRNRTLKRYVRASQSSTGSQTGNRLRHIYAVSRIHRYINKCLCVIVGREQWAQGTVNQAGNQDFIVRRLAFTTGETTRETTCTGKFLFVLHGQRHEIRTGNSVFRAAYCGKHHCVADSRHHCTVCLLGKFAGL